MKITIFDRCTVTKGDISLKAIEELGQTEVFDVPEPSDIPELLKDTEIVLCNKTVITREIMQSCKKLRYIGLFATGYNNIDTVAAKELGITVCNVPGYSTNAVAQQTMTFILQFASHLVDYNASVRNGGWCKSKTFSYFPYGINELDGKTLGIIGFGAIGKRVCELAQAFGMNVLVYTRTPKNDGKTNYCTLSYLLENSDYVTLHCPLNDGTKKLINKEALAKMKKTAVLINTSRGGVIDENALADALNLGVIAGAGLDVLTVEPMENGNRLMTAANCVLTPHIAWAAYEARTRLIDLVAENINAFTNGKPINTVQ